MSTGKDVFYTVAAVGLLYGAYKFFNSKFWDALTFDPASLGPVAALTPGAQLSKEEYIARGYYAINPDTGQYEITPAGDAYIKAQRAALGVSGYERPVSGERVY